MKTLILSLFILTIAPLNAQKNKTDLNLTNALVIGKFDNPDNRYSIEANLTELLTNLGIKAIPSINILKLGSDSGQLASDSIQQIVKEKGIDTYIIVSVRGYDKRFKPSDTKISFEEALNEGSLFDIYQEDLVSVSFEFKFFRNGEMIYSDIVKCGNISDRDSVIKRFRIKVGKRIEKRWK